MSVNKTWNNIVYSIPNTRGESGWETQLSQYLQALADNAATNIFLKQAIRKATTTPVTVSASTDCTIIVDLAGPGPSTVNLPAGADKQIFVIVDGKGDASTNNITIDANGSETIEGSLTKVIRLNRECLVLQYSSSAGDWKVIGGYVPNMVGGPASATDNAIARFDGTTGKLVQNSGVEVDDSGNIKMSYSSSPLGRINYQAASGNKVFLLQTITSTNNYGIGVDSSNLVTFGSVNAADTWDVKAIQYASSGAVTLGPATTFNYSGVTHFISGNLAVKAPTSPTTFQSGEFLLSSNLKYSTRGNRYESTLSGAGIALSTQNSGNNCIFFISNADGDATGTDGTIKGSMTDTGAWTLGTSTTPSQHTVLANYDNELGSLYVVNSAATNAAPAANFYTAAATDSTANRLVNFVRNGIGQGAIVCNGAGGVQFGAYSDERLKENLKPVESQLDKIMAIEVMRFDFKQEGWTKNCIGTTAQKMREIYPECVGEGDDEMKTLSIGGWGPTEFKLVKAIQEQQAIIDGLKARIEALENP